MGIFDQFRPKAINTEMERMIREVFGGGSTSSGVAVNSDTAMQLSTVYACVKVLYQSIAQMPCHLMERTGEGRDAVTNKATSHRLYRLLHDQPNSWQTAPEFWGMSVAHDSLRGDFLAFKTMVRGEVRELLPIDPARVIEIRQNSNWSLTYTISKDGVNKEYPQEAIFHIRGLSLNGYSGLNPIAYARESIGLGIASEKFKAKYFGKGMHPGAIITHPMALDPKTHGNMREAMRQKYAGLNNSQDLMLLENGSTITFPPIKLVDQQFLENEKFTQSQIASLFRVPLMLLQAGDDPVSYASAEQFVLSFVTHALTPIVVNIEKAIYRDLLTEEEKGRYFAKFSMNSLLRGDSSSRAKFYRELINAEVLCPNEARELEELNPYDGGWEYRTRTSTVKPESTKEKGGDEKGDTDDDKS